MTVVNEGGQTRNTVKQLQEFAKQDPVFWKPSPLLVELVERGADFSSLNQSE